MNGPFSSATRISSSPRANSRTTVGSSGQIIPSLSSRIPARSSARSSRPESAESVQ